MWQKFTESARRVILLGQEEAGKLKSGYVGNEHLLLGLIRQNETDNGQLLQALGLNPQSIREALESQLPPGEIAGAEPKLTPKAKRSLELAADEARRMRHTSIYPEHMLVSLVRDKDGLAAEVLRQQGLDIEKVRKVVEETLALQETKAFEQAVRALEQQKFELVLEKLKPVTEARDLLQAFYEQVSQKGTDLRVEHLILALLDQQSPLLAELFKGDWDEAELRQRLLERL